MNNVIYIEIDIFAALVLFIIMDRDKSALATKNQRIFKQVLMSVILVLILDAFSWGFNGTVFPHAYEINTVVNYLYWIVSLAPCYLGMLYCSYLVSPEKYVFRKWLYSIPIWFGILLLLSNIFTGWIFQITPDNYYHRGPYFLMVGALPFIHMGIAVILTMNKYFMSPRYERNQYAMLAFFMCIPLLGSLLQIFVYGIVTIWTGLTLTMLMSYVYIQRGNLYTDALTKINNRGRFDSYINWKWHNMEEKSSLYLMILDIDKFKAINDTYGHAEGDKALQRAAEVLKSVMANEKGFLARIGGDEFAIVMPDVQEEDIVNLEKAILRELEINNEKSPAPYTISFSIGHAGRTGATKKGYTKFYSEADSAMYEQKKQHSIN